MPSNPPSVKMGIPDQKDTILRDFGFNLVKQPKKSKKKSKTLSISKINSTDLEDGEKKATVVDDLFARGFVTCPVDGKACNYTHKDKTDTEMRMKTLWYGNNLGILTGQRSNLVVIDLDTPRNEGDESGIENFKKVISVVEGVPPLKDTDQWVKSLGIPAVKSPSGGYHLYYQQDERLVGLSKGDWKTHHLGKNIDVKNASAYIVAPPSVYPGCAKGCKKDGCFKCQFAGKKYKWLIRPKHLSPLPELVVGLILGSREIKEGKVVKSTPFATRQVGRFAPALPERSEAYDKDLFDQACEYVEIIDVPAERSEWIKIGIAIRAINDGEDGFLTWDNWSSSGDSYDGAIMVQQWDSFAKYRGRGAKTSLSFLRYLAQKSNPEKTAKVDEDIRKEYGHIKCEKARMLAPIPEVKPEQKEDSLDATSNDRVWSGMTETAKIIMENYYNYHSLSNGISNYGWMQIFDTLHGDDVVLVSRKKNKTAILWNGKTKLWEKVGEDAVEFKITEDLQKAIGVTLIDLARLFSTHEEQEERKKVQKQQKAMMKGFEYILSGSKASHPILKLLWGKHRSKDADFLDTLDQKRDLLSVKNGVVELRTSTLRDRRRDDFMSFAAPTSYIPNLDTSKCHKFVMDLCLDDKPKKEYLHKSCGYWLTGEMSEEIFMLLVGVQSTGKDTLQDRMKDALGKNYVVRVDIDTFLEKLGSSLPAMSQVAQMEGSRLVLTTEPGKDKKFKSDLIKSITGQTGVVGKMYHKDPRPFMPHCKVVFACNDKPKLEASGAIQRRAVEFRLEAQFRDVGDAKDPFDKDNGFHREKDASLKAAYKTKEHCQEWLAFCIEGAKAWYLKPDLKKNLPTDVLESTNSYFEENKDFVMEFVKQELNIHRNVGKDQKRLLNRTLVHTRYMEWLNLQDANDTQFTPRKPSKFYAHLTAKCGIRGKKVRGDRVLEVTFKTPPENWAKRIEV